MSTLTREQNLIAGLRAMADFYEANPGFKCPSSKYTATAWAKDKADYAEKAKMLGDAEMKLDDKWCNLIKSFSPVVELVLFIKLEQVGEYVKVGEKTVDVLEWRLQPVLAPDEVSQ